MRNKIIILSLVFVMSLWQNVFAENYRLPYSGGMSWGCSQGNDDTVSHEGVLKYAYDFVPNSGSLKFVVAMKSGTIVNTNDGCTDGDTTCGGKYGNYIVIKNIDGKYDHYAHLENASLLVGVGDFVLRGEKIAVAGNTGWSTGIHIHVHSNESITNHVQSISFVFEDQSTVCESGQPDDHDKLYAPWDTYLSDNYYTPMYNYTFPNNSSEGWTEGNNVTFMSGGDTDSMYMNVTGTNPGFVSPAFGPTVYADEVVIQFRAKVIGNSTPSDPVTVYVKDQNASWANSVTLEAVDDADYHYYVAYLSNITNASTKLVQQFSIELTEGSTSGNEYWEFDDVKVVYIGNSEATSAEQYMFHLTLPDQNGNNEDELAFLRKHPVTGQPTITVIDSGSEDLLTEIYCFDSYVIPQFLTTVDTPNGKAFQIVGRDKRNSSQKTELRYVKSGALVE